MAQSVQELIIKIKKEGIQAADERAKEIEDLARTQANGIIEDAKIEAEQLIGQAHKEIERMKTAGETALKQAARDTVLLLHKELENQLKKVILNEVSHALTKEKLSDILKEIVLQTSAQNIQVKLDPANAEALTGLMEQLRQEVKKGISLMPSEGIGNGLVISFDEGKSSFEFTDKALAEYLTNYLNPQLLAIVKKSV